MLGPSLEKEKKKEKKKIASAPILPGKPAMQERERPVPIELS